MKSRFMLGTALLVPIFLIASCDDAGQTPTGPSTDEPAVGESVGGPSMHSAGTGMKVRTFDGTRDGGFNGRSRRDPDERGADLNTFDGDDDPNNNYAGLFPVSNNIRGKRLSQVQELSFKYAGGAPSGGTPRFSIPIDNNGDGSWDAFAFIAADRCNDGDAFVGAIDGEDDPTCLVDYTDGEHANWDAFAAHHPSARIATNAITFIIADQPAHYAVWKVDIR